VNPPESDVPGSPAVVGVGVDLADVNRLATVRSRRPTIDGRVFTAAERERLEDAPDLRAAQAFGAKEAVMKALGVGLDSVSPSEIEVVGALEGIDAAAGQVIADPVRLHGRAQERAIHLGVERWEVLLGVVDGPDGEVATAEAIAWGRD
jgi:holo-[acyl-carrier protein] synthase